MYFTLFILHGSTILLSCSGYLNLKKFNKNAINLKLSKKKSCKYTILKTLNKEPYISR